MSLMWLFNEMKLWNDHPAIIWRDQKFTYVDLLNAVDIWAKRLEDEGIQPGSVIALEGDYSPAVCALMLALIERKAILVPLTKQVAVHRDKFLETAEVETIIGFSDSDDWNIERQERNASHPLIQKLVDKGAPGLILFSSGSTGESKAILHDFDLLLEKFKVPRKRKTILTFLLLDHIGGINTLLYTLSNGGTVVTAQTRDPEMICQLIEKHRVQVLPTTPTFINLLLLSEAYMRYDLASLELITYGTEVMPETTLQRLGVVFPDVKLQQTYGLSELGILRSKSRDSASLWVKVGGEGVETKVVDGILWIKAPSAMVGYLNAPDPMNDEGWLNTHDMVEVDGDYIRILGRTSDIINVGGNKVYPAEVESVLAQMENVRDVTVFGVPNVITGQMVAARLELYTPEDLLELTRRVRSFCRARLAAYKIPAKVEIVGEIQVSSRYKKVRASG